MQLELLARRQHHVVSRAQAIEADLTGKAIRWRLDRGQWRRIHDRVYLTHSVRSPGWHGPALGCCGRDVGPR